MSAFKERKITHRQVSEALGVTEQTVSNWVNGRRKMALTIGQTKRLCILLDLPIEDLPDYFDHDYQP